MKHFEVPANPRPLPEGPLYFVGIGGAGMSALAQVLAERGRRVSGADPGIAPAVRERLERVGVTIYTQHDAAQVGDAAVVVVSDAIPDANPEVNAAREQGIPIFRRPEVLGDIVNAGRGIAIAGTHGKTTTTGMVASILLAAGLDPTILIGGDLPAIGGNARNGSGEWVVAESCEAYDGFLYLHPEIAVVLNIEADHLDYHGTEQHVFDSFERFMRQVKPKGELIICSDDKPTYKVFDDMTDAAEKSLEQSRYAYSTYGLQDGHTSAGDIVTDGAKTLFTLRTGWTIYCKDDEFDQSAKSGSISSPEYPLMDYTDVPLGRVTLNVPGLHNVSNALAAASVGLWMGIAPEHIIAGLEAFTGTGRRFERIGEANGVLIVDDYAHHPTELRATLAAARSAYPERRIIAVFQPHLPSRTRDNKDAFADALTAADAVYLTDIYLAREQPIPGISSDVLAERTRALRPELPVTLVPDKNDLPARLAADVRPGDLVLTLGAGDIRAAGAQLWEMLTSPPAPLRFGEGSLENEGTANRIDSSIIPPSPAASGEGPVVGALGENNGG